MIIEFRRAFFWSIPEDFGNRGESTITKLPIRNKQWQKHHKKERPNHGESNDGVFLVYELGTAVWSRELCHVNLLLKQSGKTPVAIPRFLPSWFGLSYGAFATVYSSLVTL